MLQLEGSKHWRIYKPTVDLPLKEAVRINPRRTGRRADHGSPYQGRSYLMYLPRGYIHEAYAAEETSLHITVAVSVFRWADLMRLALARVVANDVRFRRAVPIGALGGGEISGALKDQFEELVQLIAKDARIEDTMAALSDQFLGDMPVLPGAHFLAPEEIDSIDINTVLERPKAMVCHVIPGGNFGQH